jgi:hypothetical protein
VSGFKDLVNVNGRIMSQAEIADAVVGSLEGIIAAMREMDQSAVRTTGQFADWLELIKQDAEAIRDSE